MILELHNNAGFDLTTDSPNNLNFLIGERVVPVTNTGGRQLMSSVLMHCAIRTPPTCSSKA